MEIGRMVDSYEDQNPEKDLELTIPPYPKNLGFDEFSNFS